MLKSSHKEFPDLQFRFYGLTERMSKMEATIGPIVTKLDSILNKIDDAKRIKMKKKETMQRLIENIEDDDQSKLIIIFFVYVWLS